MALHHLLACLHLALLTSLNVSTVLHQRRPFLPSRSHDPNSSNSGYSTGKRSIKLVSIYKILPPRLATVATLSWCQHPSSSYYSYTSSVPYPAPVTANKLPLFLHRSTTKMTQSTLSSVVAAGASTSTSAAAAAAAVSTVNIPPIIHAIGGSVGSTLSLLLLYPLERARIEMQAQAPFAFRRESCSVVEDEEEKGEEEKGKFCNMSWGIKDRGGGGKLDTLGDEAFTYELIDEPQQTLKQTQVQPQTQLTTTNNRQSLQPPKQAKKKESRNESVLTNRISPSSTTSSSKKTRGLWPTLLYLHQNQELYKGVQPIAFTLALSNFIFFYTLQTSKGLVSDYRKRKATTPTSSRNGASLLASTIAGVINVLLTNPFWVANLRIVQSKKATSGLFATMYKIFQTEGISHLWNGTCASLLLVSNPAMQYYIYEYAKFELVQRRRRNVLNGATMVGKAVTGNNLRPVEAFMVGALSKAFATVVTYPLQLAQVLLRLQKGEEKELDAVNSCDESSKPALYSGTLDCMMQLYKEGGFAALYTGMNAKLLQTILTAALTFLTYEQILTIVAKSYSSLATSH